MKAYDSNTSLESFYRSLKKPTSSSSSTAAVTAGACGGGAAPTAAATTAATSAGVGATSVCSVPSMAIDDGEQHRLLFLIYSCHFE